MSCDDAAAESCGAEGARDRETMVVSCSGSSILSEKDMAGSDSRAA